MLQTVRELVLPAAQERVLLLINHVLSREPAAVQRLQPHAGRHLRIELVGVPAWLPPLPPMTVAVTAAGLFETGAPTDAPDLGLQVSMPTPSQWLDMAGGQAAPGVRIDGAADLAADMHWLVDHVRWDIEGDLAQAVGRMPARIVMSLGRAGAGALRRMFAADATQA